MKDVPYVIGMLVLLAVGVAFVYGLLVSVPLKPKTQVISYTDEEEDDEEDPVENNTDPPEVEDDPVLKIKLEALGIFCHETGGYNILRTRWYEDNEVFSVGDDGLVTCMCTAHDMLYTVECPGDKPFVGLLGVYCLLCGRGVCLHEDHREDRDWSNLYKLLPRWKQDAPTLPNKNLA